MQNEQPSLFARDDTFFGVCQGLGEDFGFNPIWLRLALPVLLFFLPVVTLASYAVGGAAVLLSRVLFPDPRTASERQPIESDASTDEEPMPLAA